MSTQPTLASPRLVLTPFSPQEADELQAAANYREIAQMTRSIDFPFTQEMASAWLMDHKSKWENGSAAIFAIRKLDSRALVGAIGLEICETDHHAELGYWITKPEWNRGYATEAGLKILEFGFRHLGLNRIYAHHLVHNRASGGVLRKIGMSPEGIMRKHARKWGEFHDVVLFGILENEWEMSQNRVN